MTKSDRIFRTVKYTKKRPLPMLTSMGKPAPKKKGRVENSSSPSLGSLEVIVNDEEMELSIPPAVEDDVLIPVKGDYILRPLPSIPQVIESGPQENCAPLRKLMKKYYPQMSAGDSKRVLQACANFLPEIDTALWKMEQGRKKIKAVAAMKRLFGRVVKVLKPDDPLYQRPEVQAAIKRELDALKKRKTAKWNDFREWDTVKDEGDGTEELVGFKIVVVIKYFECGEEEWVFKARGCATGNWVIDIYGYQAFDDPDDLIGKPCDPTPARCVITQVLHNGGDWTQGDAQNAYLQAPIKGNKKYLKLPRELRSYLDIPSTMKTPCCLIEKALYGLIRSGFDWADYAKECLLEREEYLGGDPKYMHLVWAELQGAFDFDPYKPFSRFLGVYYNCVKVSERVRKKSVVMPITEATQCAPNR